MATQRYISTSFWDDEWIQTLDPSEKLLYLYLMTNPLTNIAGVYKLTIRRICFDTGFNADTAGHILGKFKKAGKAYLHGEYIILPSWPKHQKADQRSKIKEGIDAIIEKLPKDLVAYMISIRYRYLIEGYTYPPNYLDIDSDSEIDTDSECDKDTPQAATAQKTSKELSEKDLTIYNKIKGAFERISGDFADYAREGAGIKRIIKLANGDESAMIVMVKTFYDLTRSTNKFWSGQPFLPSILTSGGIWERVKLEAIKGQPDDWVEKMAAEDEKQAAV